MNLNHLVALIAACALIAIGVCLGWLAWGRQSVAILEKQAAPVWHDDGSVTAIRAPNATPVIPAPSAPAGGVLIRTVEVTVKPLPVVKDSLTAPDSGTGNTAPTESAECQPVKIRLDLREYREGPDLGVRVSIRAEGGEILDSVDIPRDTIYMPRHTENVVGLSRIGDTTTVTYQRSFGALDIGPALTFPDGQRAGVGLSVGWRF